MMPRRIDTAGEHTRSPAIRWPHGRATKEGVPVADASGLQPPSWLQSRKHRGPPEVTDEAHPLGTREVVDPLVHRMVDEHGLYGYFRAEFARDLREH